MKGAFQQILSRRFIWNQIPNNVGFRSAPNPNFYYRGALSSGASAPLFSGANARTRRHISTTPPKTSETASNPQLSFPCLDAIEARTQTLQSQCSSSTSGPEPSYATGAHERWTSTSPLLLDYGGVLYQFTIAYETWGNLNDDKSNAILLHTGLSASSHARSNEKNSQPGWWEKFIGPGKPLDTDKYFVICTNVLGGCYGSTGPSSIDPVDGEQYATRFPILTLQDMVRGQFALLDSIGIKTLYASVGASMGGMQSLAAGVLFPDRISRIVSTSGCVRSHPYSIAMRHTQRQVLMADPNWNRGFYYDRIPPHMGMKLAREIATVTYRSGPEWELRFGRERADPSKPPALCPDFLIETYLDHAGEKWCLQYDANSFLYISKAMDLFDLGVRNRQELDNIRERNRYKVALKPGEATAKNINSSSSSPSPCTLTIPEKPYAEQPRPPHTPPPDSQSRPPEDLIAGLSPLKETPTLVLGVASDILFPAWQQREIAQCLKLCGNKQVTHVELSEQQSLFGHDTFLLDLVNVGGAVGQFLNE